MAGVEEGSREELLRRVACAEEGAVVMKVRGWRVDLRQGVRGFGCLHPTRLHQVQSRQESPSPYFRH